MASVGRPDGPRIGDGDPLPLAGLPTIMLLTDKSLTLGRALAMVARISGFIQPVSTRF
ncbi:hypothetical protein ACQKLX_01275 [Bosea sp. NPDC003192]|uniref:hypothetical protein n=1 Tax=Bosea sp. NPDC003192 TaxID=3390551 RepID=UPI003D094514